MQHVSKRLTLQHPVTIPKHHGLTLWQSSNAHNCSTHYVEAYNSVKRTETFVRTLPASFCTNYNILCMLAHGMPQYHLQDTAWIPVYPKHFSAFLHLISTKSRVKPEFSRITAWKLELKKCLSRRSLDRPKFFELCGPSPIAGSDVWYQTL